MSGEIIAIVIIGIAFVNLFIQFIATYIVYPLYIKFGWFKHYYHDWEGCHSPEEGTILICRYGLEKHAICKYCGKGIKEDREGEWR